MWTKEYHYFSKFSRGYMSPYSHSKREGIGSLFLYEYDHFFYAIFYQNASLATYFQNFLVKLNTP